MALTVGHWKQGKLTAADAVDPVWGTPCKEYELACEPGRTYVIEMEARSEDFEPCVRLKDRAGRQWASDYVGGIGLNARFVFTCTRKDRYILVATTYAGDTGSFELIVRNPLELLGKPYAGVDTLSVSGPQRIRELGREERPFRAYPVKLERGREVYSIEATAQDKKLEPILLLRGAENWVKGRDDNRAGGRTARIVYHCPETAIYFVLVTSRAADRGGAFRLEMRVTGGTK